MSGEHYVVDNISSSNLRDLETGAMLMNIYG